MVPIGSGAEDRVSESAVPVNGSPRGKKVMVAGWFSFEQMGATAGDLLARDLVTDWLEEAGRPYDVATAPPFTGGVDWEEVEPTTYSEVVFVCGPFGKGPPLTELLFRFEGVPLVGVNLSVLQPLEEWNPFDLLLERDSNRTARPDISFLSRRPLVPVVGLVLVHFQEEYGDRSLHHDVNDAVGELLQDHDVAVVEIDTRLDENATGLRDPAQVESLIARMDAVVTTRLHGTVLSLKHGVPPIAIDPVAGGAKILQQAKSLEWPAVFVADSLDTGKLRDAFDWCLTEEARLEAQRCGARAPSALEVVRGQFIQYMERYRDSRDG
jgi:hypothetical protein